MPLEHDINMPQMALSVWRLRTQNIHLWQCLYHALEAPASFKLDFLKALNRTPDPGQGGAEGVPEPAEPRRLRPHQPALSQLRHQGWNCLKRLAVNSNYLTNWARVREDIFVP